MAVKVRTKYDDDDEYPEPIYIKGIPVHPQLLESQAVQRCDYRSCGSTCCRNGVYIDVDQSNMILAHQEAIKPFLRAEAQNPADWFDGIYDIDSDYPSGRGQGTNVIPHLNHKTGSACIFLRADLKCGLQTASMELGYAPWHFKPYHCALKTLVENDTTKIVLNLHEVEYMSSAGLRAMVSTLKALKRNDGDLRLCTPSPRVEEVLRLAGLTSIFQIYSSQEDAVNSF